MSNTLTKVIDKSIFPAALMIAAKFIGLYLAIELFDLEWGIDSAPNELFSARPVLFAEDIKIASSYSDLFLILVMLTGFTFFVIRAVFFSSDRIEPKMLARLAANNLTSLIKDSYEIYQTATIWLVFVWLTNITILINTLYSKTESWIFGVSIGVTLVLSVLLLRDVVNEINLAKKKLTAKD